ncbi:MAG: Fe-Mn family superoxide dismutase [Myxococcaceae bacterium]|nr:Fe-Mn family superoxide dismutase [Myxococcaceae bacterium]MCI0669988.1 Fe-Mn family superoxide dismutase [Myxococcaceae bacterium]
MAEMSKKYTPRTYTHLKGLKGISDGVLETHVKLYEGYVNRLNKLLESLQGLVRDKQTAGNPVFAELTRRLGFEWNGMVLHEHYFENLKAGGTGQEPGGKLKKAMEQSFGSYDAWLTDFRGICTMPGIGWAMTYQDPGTGMLSNHWIGMHEENHVAGYKPILIMDAWEHAFVPDYKPTERAKYVDAYFQNINWDAAESRLVK